MSLRENMVICLSVSRLLNTIISVTPISLKMLGFSGSSWGWIKLEGQMCTFHLSRLVPFSAYWKQGNINKDTQESLWCVHVSSSDVDPCRSNRIWAPFSVRKVHPDFHSGYTSLQTYRPDTNFITVSASHTGINCDPSATASQVGVNCTTSVLCLFFYFSRLDALELTIYTTLASDSQGSPTYTSQVMWLLVWGMYDYYVSDTVGHVLSQNTVFSDRYCQASEMAQQVRHLMPSLMISVWSSAPTLYERTNFNKLSFNK